LLFKQRQFLSNGTPEHILGQFKDFLIKRHSFTKRCGSVSKYIFGVNDCLQYTASKKLNSRRKKMRSGTIENLNMSFGPGLPDFSWYMIPKPEKMYQLIKNAPNGHKISQIFREYSKWP
jgi:hypothetical protein